MCEKITVNILISLCLSFFCAAQNSNRNEIEQKKKEVENINVMDKTIISLYKEIYLLSKEDEYKRGMLFSLTGLAAYYLNKGDTYNSIKVIEEGLLLAEDLKDYPRNAMLLEEKGAVLLTSGNHTGSRSLFSKALKIADMIKDKDSMHAVKGMVYTRLLSYTYICNEKYKNIGYKDSILYFAKKGYDETLKLSGKIKGSTEMLGQSASSLGFAYSWLGYEKEGKFYFAKAENILANSLNKSFLAEIYIEMGRFAFEKKDLKESLLYYQKALDLSKKDDSPLIKMRIYDFFVEYYKKAGNKDQELHYIKKSKKINDSLSQINQQALIAQYKSDTNTMSKKHQNNRNILILISIFLAFLIGFLSIKLWKNKKRQSIQECEIKSENTPVLTLTKQMDTEKISLLLEMAKNNDNQFFITFQYEFHILYQKLLTLPELTNTDIELCAYLKLNLQTKEIATLKKVSIGAVDNRKYRIRKKLGLLPETDLYKWINSL
ncbi:hypothetical protein CMU59_18365 [Elizabethkingia anophelis]|uniref:tetratricopeptide repeat protein n=1 Tax=Elizabethkingia anophelis TaxID=1117645 RepID=UPI002013648C|nr:tetratricopeptide repeat protein [Elizabethkingia anophelis]MCL1690054.1 tetratricopeptide repeat protein [Elizabethkingia anophelis]MDV3575739.1 hypothetical protein [Elizabethkingia anophelis]MDV3601502.1 hypothetical protein [Elizabethkingia anophelis]MDV3608561.1 hypothetical protein [Elizabethkingia anophelis]MDV3640607.1 hypothetical protein [Elizabethkingia anophelis]